MDAEVRATIQLAASKPARSIIMTCRLYERDAASPYGPECREFRFLRHVFHSAPDVELTRVVRHQEIGESEHGP